MPDHRPEQIERLRKETQDVLVVGGGINGAGILRDLALRSQHAGGRLQIGLIEQNHFASGTSGKNSQLIHGGLRYLKYFQFHLVRESLRERSVLMRIAPHYVKPLPFLLPMYGTRPRLLYGTGLRIYDWLAGSQAIAPHRILSMEEVARMEPELSRDGLKSAAIFYDCSVPSARFVVENIMDAVANGAAGANYVQAESWNKGVDGNWRVLCIDRLSGEKFEICARKLVDARGAWSGRGLRLVRGSHIVVPRINVGDYAIAHFEPDGRIIFLIPWGSRNQLTLIGTTDEDHAAGPDQVHITKREIDYLLAILCQLCPAHAAVKPVSTFSSLRPLIGSRDGSPTSASRDYKIWNTEDGVLHVAGGKYTIYRLMSEQAGDLICREIAPQLAEVHRTAETPFTQVERDIGDAFEEHLWDYLFVTTYLGYERLWDREALNPYAERLGQKRGWEESRVQREIDNIVKPSESAGATGWL